MDSGLSLREPRNDEWHGFASSRRSSHPSSANLTRPSTEGAGKAGCPLHPQPRVQNEKAHEQVTTGPPDAIRLSLRDGFTAYSALSPAIGLVVTVPPEKR